METIVKLITNKSEYDIRNASKYSINVEDLIEILEEYPKDAKIVFSNDNGYTFGQISSNDVCVIEVETFEEEKVRQEQEDEQGLVCPYCESDNIVYNFSGYWQCLDCNKKFKKAKLK